MSLVERAKHLLEARGAGVLVAERDAARRELDGGATRDSSRVMELQERLDAVLVEVGKELPPLAIVARFERLAPNGEAAGGMELAEVGEALRELADEIGRVEGGAAGEDEWLALCEDVAPPWALAWMRCDEKLEDASPIELVSGLYDMHSGLIARVVDRTSRLAALSRSVGSYCRHATGARDVRVASDGAIGLGTCSFDLAIVDYGVRRLRILLEEAFPGLRALLVGDPRSESRHTSIYRTASAAPAPDTFVTDLLDRIESAGVRERLDCALAHGTMLAAMEAVDRRGSGRGSDAARKKQRQWHKQALCLLRAETQRLVFDCARAVDAFRIQQRLCDIHEALDDVRAVVTEGESALPRLAGIDELMSAASDVAATVKRLDLSHVGYDVAEGLRWAASILPQSVGALRVSVDTETFGQPLVLCGKQDVSEHLRACAWLVVTVMGRAPSAGELLELYSKNSPAPRA